MYGELKKAYFVTGIDTDTGKSYATGWLAREWRTQGHAAVTLKLIQTGCDGMSEDILIHRRVMGIDLLPEDLDNTTCPIRFSYPASPDMAARLEGRTIDLTLADRATEKLIERYERVLIEGAGGLMVPIEGDYTMLDYAAERKLPTILVTNSRLGSVNHTLLSLLACAARGVEVDFVIYNLSKETSREITDETRRYLKEWLGRHMPGCIFLEPPLIDLPDNNPKQLP